MSLLSRLREKHSGEFATETLATQRPSNTQTVARVATVAVANSRIEPAGASSSVAKVATVAVANSRIEPAGASSSVAKVATVAVATSKNDKFDLPPSTPMTASEERAIRAWLAQIGETEEGIITETLRQCSIDEGERAFFLERAKDLPQPDTYQDDRRHCRECRNLTYNGLCLAASRGEIDEIRNYHPADKLPRRCKGYVPRSNILSLVVPA